MSSILQSYPLPNSFAASVASRQTELCLVLLIVLLSVPAWRGMKTCYSALSLALHLWNQRIPGKIIYCPRY
jgi:hypothetical protein